MSTERVPIRIEIFESAFKRYSRKAGTSFGTLAKEMKVPVARLREWRRTGLVPEDKLPVLAGALGIAPERLMRSQDGRLQPAAGVLLPRAIGHNILTVARTFRSYTRFLGAQRRHPDYRHQEIIHHPGDEAFYATFFLETSAEKQEWLFSVWFGLRMDYGTVRLQPNGDTVLDPIMQEQEPQTLRGLAALNDEGNIVVPVRTWFGRPRCDFVIHSDHPFTVRYTREPVHVPGSVTFVKNAFQKDE